MELSELLKVIQVQRHDFLNHLQVISGLIQLSKSEKVSEYINQVCEGMAALSVVTKLSILELKAVLLVAVYTAKKYQVEFVFDINTSMAGCIVPGDVLGRAVEECINQALEKLSAPDIEDWRLMVTIIENKKHFFFRFEFPGLLPETVTDLVNKLHYCRSLSKQGIQLDMLVKPASAGIYLSIPR